MSRTRARGLRSGLLAALIGLGLAVALLIFVPQSPAAINSSHTTTYPTPGAVTLPPTAPAATPTAR